MIMKMLVIFKVRCTHTWHASPPSPLPLFSSSPSPVPIPNIPSPLCHPPLHTPLSCLLSLHASPSCLFPQPPSLFFPSPFPLPCSLFCTHPLHGSPLLSLPNALLLPSLLSLSPPFPYPHVSLCFPFPLFYIPYLLVSYFSSFPPATSHVISFPHFPFSSLRSSAPSTHSASLCTHTLPPYVTYTCKYTHAHSII